MERREMERKEIKQMSAEQVRELIEVGRQVGYNRQLSDAVIDKLDPSGVNMASIALIHTHIGGKLVAPHLRCFLYLKFTGQDEPVEAMADLPFSMWESLPGVVVNEGV